jgi:hypothetical protein
LVDPFLSPHHNNMRGARCFRSEERSPRRALEGNESPRSGDRGRPPRGCRGGLLLPTTIFLGNENAFSFSKRTTPAIHANRYRTLLAWRLLE